MQCNSIKLFKTGLILSLGFLRKIKQSSVKDEKSLMKDLARSLFDPQITRTFCLAYARGPSMAAGP